MNVVNITIAACIWQSGRFDPLVSRDKKGRWTFVSEEFDMQADKNFARQTLERGLFRKVKGTLNPTRFHKRDVRLTCTLAAAQTLVVCTSMSGERLVRRPCDPAVPVRIYVVLPMFGTGQALEPPLPEGWEYLSRVGGRGGLVQAVVEQVMTKKRSEWSDIRLGKTVLPRRPDFGKTAVDLRRMGMPPDMVERVTRPHNEAYWQPSADDLKASA